MRDLPSLIYHFPEVSPPNTITKELRGIQGSPVSTDKTYDYGET